MPPVRHWAATVARLVIEDQTIHRVILIKFEINVINKQDNFFCSVFLFYGRLRIFKTTGRVRKYTFR